MINKIHKIAVITDDIEGAVQFYTQKLGLTVVERFENDDDEDYVFLDAGGILLELMPQKTMGQEAGFHHISFEVDSVEDSAQELKDKGVHDHQGAVRRGRWHRHHPGIFRRAQPGEPAAFSPREMRSPCA